MKFLILFIKKYLKQAQSKDGIAYGDLKQMLTDTGLLGDKHPWIPQLEQMARDAQHLKRAKSS